MLMDEAELSAVSGKPVASSLLKTCPLSGKRADQEATSFMRTSRRRVHDAML
jgi:hypothetical protein